MNSFVDNSILSLLAELFLYIVDLLLKLQCGHKKKEADLSSKCPAIRQHVLVTRHSVWIDN
jgi:hypothetical protein